jgi:NADPH-dependent glutamate synthase beta subunit-like oxidoreductase
LREEVVPCEFVLRSVGYRSEMCDEDFLASFWDAKRSVVATKEGGKVGNNVYASGWLKRGPSGIVGTNIPDAKETVDVLVRDLLGEEATRRRTEEDLETLLRREGRRFVDWQGVKRIHRYEEEKGKAEGRPRSKIDSIEDMLRVAAA